MSSVRPGLIDRDFYAFRKLIIGSKDYRDVWVRLQNRSCLIGNRVCDRVVERSENRGLGDAGFAAFASSHATSRRSNGAIPGT